MGDVIRGAPPHIDDVGAAMYNQETLRDNHDNTYRGGYLTCAGSRTVRLLPVDDGAMLDSLEAVEYSLLSLFAPSGKITMHFGEESPLQTTCRELDARHALTPLAPHTAKPGRTK
jgi:hypothetical protein